MTCLKLLMRATLLGILLWSSLAHVTYAVAQNIAGTSSPVDHSADSFAGYAAINNSDSDWGTHPAGIVADVPRSAVASRLQSFREHHQQE